MAPRKRKPKNSDQSEAEKAFRLIEETIRNNPQVEVTLWAPALWGILARSYRISGFSYEEFCQEIDNAKIHFKRKWD